MIHCPNSNRRSRTLFPVGPVTIVAPTFVRKLNESLFSDSQRARSRAPARSEWSKRRQSRPRRDCCRQCRQSLRLERRYSPCLANVDQQPRAGQTPDCVRPARLRGPGRSPHHPISGKQFARVSSSQFVEPLDMFPRKFFDFTFDKVIRYLDREPKLLSETPRFG